jgi:hypothetical protein
VQTFCFDFILCFYESFSCNWQTPFTIHARKVEVNSIKKKQGKKQTNVQEECLREISKEWKNSDTGQATLVEKMFMPWFA